MDPSSINERPAIWADTIRIAKDFWLTGTELNTYGISTRGLLLGVSIFLTILAFAGEVRRRLREDVGSIWWIRMGAVIGLVAIAFQTIGEFSLQMPGNAALFAVVAGLAIHDGRRL